MQTNELIAELPMLLAFAKVSILDRDQAYWRVWAWLDDIGRDPERLAWTRRQDAYRAVLGRPAMRGFDRSLKAGVSDPLVSPLMQDMSWRERVLAFLTGPAGFNEDAAHAIAARSYAPALRAFSPGPASVQAHAH